MRTVPNTQVINSGDDWAYNYFVVAMDQIELAKFDIETDSGMILVRRLIDSGYEPFPVCVQAQLDERSVVYVVCGKRATPDQRARHRWGTENSP